MTVANLVREYQQCTVCVMDTSDAEIAFDEAGRCEHCARAERLLRLLPDSVAEGRSRMERLAASIKNRAPDAEYHCVVGLSGGVDSSYVAWLAHQAGLRVLAVHLDNGWNTEIAVSNIHAICERLDFELATLVIDWEEFRDLQRSFLLASVIDVELVTDHAIFASMIQLAKKHDVPVILSGSNLATEAIMPRTWAWPKQDRRNIVAIHKRFGSVPLRTFPLCGVWRWGLLRYAPWPPRYVAVLNEVPYRRTAAIEELRTEVGWREYGEKHHESVFTRYYQCGILPTKFGVDKRHAHLSNLIVNGEITREAALAELSRPPCPPDVLADDEAYVMKKLGFSRDELDAILGAAPVPHDAFPSSKFVFGLLTGARERARAKASRASA